MKKEEKMINKSVKSLILFTFLLTFCLACSDSDKMEGVYRSYFADSVFTYKFFADGSYLLHSDGHIGRGFTTGLYAKGNDILFIREDNDHFGNCESKTFRIIDEDCIRSYDNYYYFSDTLNAMELVNNTVDYSHRILDSINNLSIWVDKAEEILQQDSTVNTYPHEDGIKTISGEDYVEYAMVKFLIKYSRYQYFYRVYVKPMTFEVYRFENDSLKRI
ncbi:MAG: hypothetical protein AB8G22_08040, partial [Saprospiraceae bacterium]